MAQDAIKNIVGNRDAIRKLMAMDANGMMDKIVENAQTEGTLSVGDEGLNYIPKQKPINEQAMQTGKINPNAHAKMPKAILESFQKNPGQPMQNIGTGNSVLDGINFTPMQQKPLQESTQQSVQNIGGGNIDYSLIKTIINEAVQTSVKKYMAAMTKKLMTEGVNANKGSTIKAIKMGDKFSWITDNGDIYEATLKFKRNINTIND